MTAVQPSGAIAVRGVYNGLPFAASATAVGLDGHTPVNLVDNFANLVLTYYMGGSVSGSGSPWTAAADGRGHSYTVVASFTSFDPNYGTDVLWRRSDDVHHGSSGASPR